MPAEPDAVPHPREREILIGQGGAERAIAEAAEAGRLHHAWLVGGSAGIGKATLAYRVARYLLSPPAERLAPGRDLSTMPGSRTSRLIAAGSHPNVVTIDLAAAAADSDRASGRTITVKTARRALAFFGSTAADGGHRVCIVDAADDLNAAAANALLKTVEEPPPRSTILVVTHAPHAVLPTIRSRCRKLALAPLGSGEVAEVLETLGPAVAGEGRTALERAAARAEGSIRRALALLDPGRTALLDETASLLASLPDPPLPRVLALAEKVADRKRDGDFELLLDAVQLWVADRVRATSAAPAARLAPLAELCENVADEARSVETYNLDRRPFVLSLFGDLARAVRLAG